MSANDTYVIFELADAAYALRSADVQHLEMLEHVTPVPNTAAAVEGVVFTRGTVVPAVNLRVRFGLPRAERTPRTRLVFIQAHGRVVALIVDSAREFRRIDPSSIRAIESTLVGISGNYVKGVATVKDRSVLILDLEAVLTLDEVTVPDSAATTPAAATS